MKLVVVSHKPCWPSADSPTGYATDGGFPIQMRALSQLFDVTTLLVPVRGTGSRDGSVPLTGDGLSVIPLTAPRGRGAMRKLLFPLWLARNAWTLLREIGKSDAVHAPIPGDVGTAGFLVALLLRKRLFVRHCGNWMRQKTAADRFWKWSMERFAGRDRVMLATGGASGRPSGRNDQIGWVFASSMTERELALHGRCREGFREESPRLLCTSRVERDKGIGAAVGSLLLVRQVFPAATLEVVGDGSALPELRRLAQHLGLQDAVTFIGKVDHAAVLERMSRADLFCYPTQSSEGFPKVVLEAIACGLPVVATPVSVLPRLLAGGAGLLVEESSAEAVAKGVLACLTDREGYRAMSRAAVSTARSYSLETWRDAIGERLTGAWGPLKCASASR